MIHKVLGVICLIAAGFMDTAERIGIASAAGPVNWPLGTTNWFLDALVVLGVFFLAAGFWQSGLRDFVFPRDSQDDQT